MPQFMNPPQVSTPLARFSHAVLIERPSRRLIISGQLGVDASGAPREGLAAQCEQAFDNIFAILASVGMAPADLVKLGIFCVEPGGAAVVRPIRDRRLDAGAPPASTFLYVAGLAHPACLVEIEAEAIQETSP